MTYYTKKLDEVCNVDYGTRVVRSRIIPGDFYVYGGGGKTFTLNEYNREDCVIVSRFAMSPYCVRRISGKFFLNDSGLSVSTKDQKVLLQDFVDKFLFASQDQIYSLGRGQAQRNLHIDEFKNLEIPLPPLSEQKKIVKILDEKMGKIAEMKRLREEALADTGKILSQTLREIFEEGKKKGWEEKELREVCRINPSKDLKKLTKNDEVTFVPMRAVNEYDQEIKYQEIKKIKDVEKGYTYFAESDVLFAKITPCMENGKVAIARNLKNKIGFGTTEFHVLRANKDIILPEFIYEIVRSKAFRLEAEQRMTGSAGQKRVPKDFLEKYKIKLPPITEQQKIVKRLDVLSAKIRQAIELQKSQLEDLTKLEKAYLREAFNGELI